MKRNTILVLSSLIATFLIVASIAIGEPAKDDMKLPPGMTEADMKAYMEASTPGKNHQYLAKGAGTWTGKQTQLLPDGTVMGTTDVTVVVTPIIDGKFVKVEATGEMVGVGPFHGFGLYGFDNVSGKFQCTWIDNMGTGMLQGTGELSADEKTVTWTYNFNCPLNKEPMKMREIDTYTSENTKTMEMIGPDPKTGKESKMISIELTRKQ